MRREAEMRNIENRLRRVLGPNFDVISGAKAWKSRKIRVPGVHMPQRCPES
jgi:hypothetical protein